MIAVAPTGPVDAFVSQLAQHAKQTPILAGFDFPIGVPAGYGARTGLADFPALLRAIGTGQ